MSLFTRRAYTQESQNWPTVVSGSSLWKSIVQTPARSGSNFKDKSGSSRNCGAEFGKPTATAIPLIPLLGPFFLCVNAVMGGKKREIPNIQLEFALLKFLAFYSWPGNFSHPIHNRPILEPPTLAAVLTPVSQLLRTLQGLRDPWVAVKICYCPLVCCCQYLWSLNNKLLMQLPTIFLLPLSRFA